MARFRLLFIFVVCYLINIAIVIGAFANIETKFVAGLVAGKSFILMGLIGLMIGLKNRLRSVLTVHLIFLVGFAVPMFGARAIWYRMAFEEMTFWFVLPAQVFHKSANYYYLLMVAVTLVAVTRRALETKKASQRS